MEKNKLRHLIDKYNLVNILKVVILLLVLLLLARILIPTSSNLLSIPDNKITRIEEGFTALSYAHYGNQLSLQDPTNIPIYAGNKSTFKFDGIYRIEALKIKFNNNPNVSDAKNAINSFAPDTAKTIYIQYEDGNGNLQYIQSSVESSPPNFLNNSDLKTSLNLKLNSELEKDKLIDENNLAIYTSKIIITVGDINNSMDSYVDACGVGYISNFAFWGSTRDMLSQKDFENLSSILNQRTLAYNNSSYDESANTDKFNYSTTVDYLMYGLVVRYSYGYVNKANQAISAPNNLGYTDSDSNATTTTAGFVNNILAEKKVKCYYSTDSPFKLMLTYNNGIYQGNNFNINTQYYVRSDIQRIDSSTNTTHIIFAQPFIANQITIAIPRVHILNEAGDMMKLIINGVDTYGTQPSTADIAKYQKTVNALLNAAKGDSDLEICPSMDSLVSKQNQVQQICDNLDYQDRIKSEKLRLEKNKQYLLKLKQQEEHIDKLNTVIQTLDSKRQSRAKNADMARLIQYQQQKGTSSAVRDLANQRLQSQANNQLYMDVNINTI
jgi:hypothetical protein